MRKMIERIIAAALAVLFMALVRPDPMPTLWQTALVTVLTYWTARLAMDGIAEDIRGSRRDSKRMARDRPTGRRQPHREIIWTDEDMRRWAGTTFSDPEKKSEKFGKTA